MLCIGVFYSRGLYYVQNDILAFRWFYLAASRGSSKAKYFLATMFSDGVGTKKSPYLSLLYAQAASHDGLQEASEFLAGPEGK